jgi:hypothetical protein
MQQKRLIVAVIMLIVLGLLLIYSNLEYNNHTYGLKYILQHFDSFNNTKISFDGYVITADESNHTIILQTAVHPWFIWVKIPHSQKLPQKEDFIEIYGTLTTREHVTAEKIYVTAPWQKNLIYLRSLPAIPFGIFLFYKTWMFNRKKIRFERRNHA